MNDLIDKSSVASLCGMVTTVCVAKTSSLIEESDGSVTVEAGTQGNNENVFKVVVRAKEAAAQQLKASQQNAITKGVPVFRFQVSGPMEVELETNKLGVDNKPLALHIAAITARPVHPKSEVDPLQNAALLTARVVKRTFKSGGSVLSLEFGHLSSAIDEGMSPVAIKLTKASEEKLLPHTDQDVMVAGTFTRQTAEEPKDGYSAYDHLSFTVDSAQLIQISAGRTRYQKGPKANANTVITSDYESGYESDGAAAFDKSELDGLDF